MTSSTSGPVIVPQRVSYRKWESPYALPFQDELNALGANTLAYAFVPFSSPDMSVGGVVQPGATAYGQMTQEDDCYITHLCGSIINPAEPGAGGGNFTVQFYDSDRQKLWQAYPFFFGNVMGTARHPFFLRRIYKLPCQGQLKCSVVNLSTFAAEIQVVAWGLRADKWKAVS
jgi:hypothetical protein